MEISLNLLRKHSVSYLLAIWLIGTIPCANAVITLRTAAQEGSVPRFVPASSPEGAATGLCIDLLRAIERVDPEIRFTGDQTWMPLTRIEAELAAGVQDVGPCFVKDAEREANLVFVEPPLYQMTFSLAARADDNVQIRTWDDVRKLGSNGVVLSLRTSGPAKRAQKMAPGVTFDDSASSVELNLRKLVAGRGRFAYYSTPALRQNIERAGLTGKIRILTPPMDGAPVYLTVGKHVPKETVEKLRRAILQLHASGELPQLVQKWGNQ
jgi:ABC-type amino acid transport substrate-binding protein